MAFSDGTTPIEREELERDYPVVITEDFRKNEQGNEIFLINRIPETSPLFALSDPHLENDGKGLFYLVFSGEDADPAFSGIARFLYKNRGQRWDSVHLARAEENGAFYEYGFGEIQADMIADQVRLQELLPEDCRNGPVFVLPLKMSFFSCPVCCSRTLQRPSDWDICVVCGWEDDGFVTDEDDDGFGANGFDYTIRDHRRNFLSIRKKNPSYVWYDDTETMELEKENSTKGDE